MRTDKLGQHMKAAHQQQVADWLCEDTALHLRVGRTACIVGGRATGSNAFDDWALCLGCWHAWRGTTKQIDQRAMAHHHSHGAQCTPVAQQWLAAKRPELAASVAAARAPAATPLASTAATRTATTGGDEVHGLRLTVAVLEARVAKLQSQLDAGPKPNEYWRNRFDTAYYAAAD